MTTQGRPRGRKGSAEALARTKLPTFPEESETTRRDKWRPQLMAYMRTRYEFECSEAGSMARAHHGDVAAARVVLALFCKRWRGIITGEPELMQAMDRLVGRMLEQPDAALQKALGFQSVRKSSERQKLERVIYFAVDHARERLGPWREVKLACKMVSQAAGRLREIFPNPPSEENVERTFNRVKSTDPMGWGMTGPSKN